MDLLFEPEQTDAGVRGVRCKLWAELQDSQRSSEFGRKAVLSLSPSSGNSDPYP